MTPTPHLVPIVPTAGPKVPVSATPFWIGSGTEVGLHLSVTEVAERHVAVMRNEDGYWLNPERGVKPQPLLNGVHLTNTARLRDGDHVQVVPGIIYEFVTGEPRAHTSEKSAEREITRGGPGRNGERNTSLTRGHVEPRRRVGAWLGVLALLLALGGGITILVEHYSFRNGDLIPLPAAEAVRMAELVDQGAMRIERGATLLDLGQPKAAQQQFVVATSLIDESDLRLSPWARARDQALEVAAADVYRSRRLEVPVIFANAVRNNALPARMLPQGMTTQEFARRLDMVLHQFASQTQRDVHVLGRDTPLHVALFGAGSAADLQVSDLTESQRRDLMTACRAQGLRVRDFSADSLAGPAREDNDEKDSDSTAVAPPATTGGGHLHVDRYASPSSNAIATR